MDRYLQIQRNYIYYVHIDIYLFIQDFFILKFEINIQKYLRYIKKIKYNKNVFLGALLKKNNLYGY